MYKKKLKCRFFTLQYLFSSNGHEAYKASIYKQKYAHKISLRWRFNTGAEDVYIDNNTENHAIYDDDDDDDDGDDKEDESEDEQRCSDNLVPNIAACAIQHNISHLALNGLMHLLREDVDKDLSVDARTVLSTPKYIEVSKKCGGGLFWH